MAYFTQQQSITVYYYQFYHGQNIFRLQFYEQFNKITTAIDCLKVERDHAMDIQRVMD